MVIRLSKVLLLAAIALFALLTAFNNITDYAKSLPVIQQVLQMEQVFPNTTLTYRAISNPVIHHAAYIFIIVMESITAILCWIGVWMLCTAIKSSAKRFNQAKNMAILGLTIGFLTWQVIFMSIGSEWFGMWMSPQLNGAIQAAFQIFITILAVLIYIAHKDDELVRDARHKP